MTSLRPDIDLHWLPEAGDFNARLADALRTENPRDVWPALVTLGNRRLDFLQTMKLDRAVMKLAPILQAASPRTIRLALTGSSTLDHLVPGIRVGALRRGLLAEVRVAPFGQWRQEILDPNSDLARFAPDAVLLSLDGSALLPALAVDAGRQEVAQAVDTAVKDLAGLWRIVRDRLRASVIQQTLLPLNPPLFGHYERLVPSAPRAVAARLDFSLVEAAAEEGVLLLDLQAAALEVGMRRLTDPMLWHHAKQEIAPAAVPWAGDQVGRILAALRGLSRKVLVLDLDNTLWGGVIGDDGLDGIVLGQGSATGEAFAAFQHYVKRLSERGVVLAVSSKNETAIAEEAFASHPEMVLRREDIAVFEASWGDKPAALRRIAADLNLGLDALVFFDDNPVERDLVRRTLPEVAVPEVPEAVEQYAPCLAAGGYFESVSFTPDDRRRTEQYAANQRRRQLEASTTDLEGYLQDLAMRLTVAPFRIVDLSRIAQLINKTNQFNLTTRRYTEAEVRAMMDDPEILTFSARLDDRFGSNGIISIVIGRLIADRGGAALDLDTWLMSCRVLGRSVEHALLAVIAETAREAGAKRLIGRYRSTPKNGMVRDLYGSLGFQRIAGGEEEETIWEFPLEDASIQIPGYFELVTTAEAAQ